MPTVKVGNAVGVIVGVAVGVAVGVGVGVLAQVLFGDAQVLIDVYTMFIQEDVRVPSLEHGLTCVELAPTTKVEEFPAQVV
jgi:uncharacterized membrane protein YgaE (UPF0421/DUF939 family)